MKPSPICQNGDCKEPATYTVNSTFELREGILNAAYAGLYLCDQCGLDFGANRKTNAIHYKMEMKSQLVDN